MHIQHYIACIAILCNKSSILLPDVPKTPANYFHEYDCSSVSCMWCHTGSHGEPCYSGVYIPVHVADCMLCIKLLHL